MIWQKLKHTQKISLENNALEDMMDYKLLINLENYLNYLKVKI